MKILVLCALLMVVSGDVSHILEEDGYHYNSPSKPFPLPVADIPAATTASQLYLPPIQQVVTSTSDKPILPAATILNADSTVLITQKPNSVPAKYLPPVNVQKAQIQQISKPTAQVNQMAPKIIAPISIPKPQPTYAHIASVSIPTTPVVPTSYPIPQPTYTPAISKLFTVAPTVHQSFVASSAAPVSKYLPPGSSVKISTPLVLPSVKPTPLSSVVKIQTNYQPEPQPQTLQPVFEHKHQGYVYNNNPQPPFSLPQPTTQVHHVAPKPVVPLSHPNPQPTYAPAIPKLSTVAPVIIPRPTVRQPLIASSAASVTKYLPPSPVIKVSSHPAVPLVKPTPLPIAIKPQINDQPAQQPQTHRPDFENEHSSTVNVEHEHQGYIYNNNPQPAFSLPEPTAQVHRVVPNSVVPVRIPESQPTYAPISIPKTQPTYAPIVSVSIPKEPSTYAPAVTVSYPKPQPTHAPVIPKLPTVAPVIVPRPTIQQPVIASSAAPVSKYLPPSPVVKVSSPAANPLVKPTPLPIDQPAQQPQTHRPDFENEHSSTVNVEHEHQGYIYNNNPQPAFSLPKPTAQVHRVIPNSVAPVRVPESQPIYAPISIPKTQPTYAPIVSVSIPKEPSTYAPAVTVSYPKPQPTHAPAIPKLPTVAPVIVPRPTIQQRVIASSAAPVSKYLPPSPVVKVSSPPAVSPVKPTPLPIDQPAQQPQTHRPDFENEHSSTVNVEHEHQGYIYNNSPQPPFSLPKPTAQVHRVIPNSVAPVRVPESQPIYAPISIPKPQPTYAPIVSVSIPKEPSTYAPAVTVSYPKPQPTHAPVIPKLPTVAPVIVPRPTIQQPVIASSAAPVSKYLPPRPVVKVSSPAAIPLVKPTPLPIDQPAQQPQTHQPDFENEHSSTVNVEHEHQGYIYNNNPQPAFSLPKPTAQVHRVIPNSVAPVRVPESQPIYAPISIPKPQPTYAPIVSVSIPKEPSTYAPAVTVSYPKPQPTHAPVIPKLPTVAPVIVPRPTIQQPVVASSAAPVSKYLPPSPVVKVSSPAAIPLVKPTPLPIDQPAQQPQTHRPDFENEHSSTVNVEHEHQGYIYNNNPQPAFSLPKPTAQVHRVIPNSVAPVRVPESQPIYAPISIPKTQPTYAPIVSVSIPKEPSTYAPAVTVSYPKPQLTHAPAIPKLPTVAPVIVPRPTIQQRVIASSAAPVSKYLPPSPVVKVSSPPAVSPVKPTPLPIDQPAQQPQTHRPDFENEHSSTVNVEHEHQGYIYNNNPQPAFSLPKPTAQVHRVIPNSVAPVRVPESQPIYAPISIPKPQPTYAPIVSVSIPKEPSTYAPAVTVSYPKPQPTHAPVIPKLPTVAPVIVPRPTIQQPVIASSAAPVSKYLPPSPVVKVSSPPAVPLVKPTPLPIDQLAQQPQTHRPDFENEHSSTVNVEHEHQGYIYNNNPQPAFSF